MHDLLGTRCDPYVNKMLTGKEFDYCCHSNLVRAVLPYGLTESDVHDGKWLFSCFPTGSVLTSFPRFAVLNVFQCTGLNPEDKYFMRDSPSVGRPHPSSFSFFAEQPLLCALSTCPGGDLSLPMWGEGAEDGTEGDLAVSVCRPLKVEVFALPDGVLKGWKPPKVVDYKGQHGLRPVEWSRQT